MIGLTQHGRRALGVALLLVVGGALVPATTLAQSVTKPDSVAKKDSTLTHTASGKRSRLGALGRAAVSKASGAADKVEQTTGVSKETMAKAALASTGVGAAAMLVKPDSGGLASSVTSNVASAAGRSMLQKMKDARAGRNGAKVGATPQAPGGPTGGIPVGAGMTAQQMALYQQQMAMAQMQQAGAMSAGGGAMGNSAEMQRLQAEYMQMAMRASSGDAAAGKQMTRFSQEWASAVVRLQGLPPAQLQGAYEAALRDALACATSGKSCKS